MPMNNSAERSSSFAAYDYYERRLCAAVAEMPPRMPWIAEHRAEIARILRQRLGIRDEWLPTIRAERVRTVRQQRCSVDFLTFRSWDNVYGAAHLYVPDSVQTMARPLPLVLLCCGHGKHGKLNPDYQAAARRLARQGAYVLVPDVIGHGERLRMGHAEAVHPFACGTSVQGLIALEALAWIDWACRDPRFDAGQLAAIGNSGGGTLTCLLAALSDKLAALSSSGYPSTFEYIARCKEKLHCHCNIIPGIVGELEMWQLYGLFAPKPLFLFQGELDRLFPQDLFFQVARKVKYAYAHADAEDRLQFATYPGEHAWDSRRRMELSAFLAKHLDLLPAESIPDDTAESLDASQLCWPAPPDDAITINELAMRLSGQRHPDDIRLWDVFPPRASGRFLDERPLRNGTHRQMLAQFEAFLK